MLWVQQSSAAGQWRFLGFTIHIPFTSLEGINLRQGPGYSAMSFWAGMKTRLWVTEVQGVHWIVSSADDMSFWKTFIKQKLHKTILKVRSCVNIWLLYSACYCKVCKCPDVLSVQFSTQVFVLWNTFAAIYCQQTSRRHPLFWECRLDEYVDIWCMLSSQ